MPRIDEARGDPRRHVDGDAVAHGAKQAAELRHILVVVERLERREALLFASPILTLQVAELEAERVAQDHLTELEGWLRSEDRAVVAAFG